MGDESAHLARLLREAGQDPTMLLAAHEAAEWLVANHRRIRALVGVVAGWPMGIGGRPELVWHHGAHPAFGDPGPAFAAAEDAVAAHRRGDDAELEQLLARWAADPVFALTVAEHLEVADVVEQLRVIEEQLRSPSTDREHRRSEGLLASLATVLATASTYELSPFSLVELVDAGRGAGLSRAAVALLFAPTAVWSTSWLVEAVKLLVVPLTTELVRDGPQVAYRTVGGEVRDVRLPVLVAVSLDPAAARRMVHEVDLAGLVRAEAAYLDDGRALAAVVQVGTWPGPDLAASDRSLAHLGALAFIRAVPVDEPLPPALLTALGVIAAPYIGAFRTDASEVGRSSGPDAGRPINPLPSLEEREAREYLDVASASPVAAQDLRSAATIWTAVALAELPGTVPEPSALHDIGAVRRFVEEGTRGWERTQAARHDAERQQERQVLGRLAQLPALFPPIKAVAAVAPFAVGRLAPDRHDELHHLASVPQLIGHDQEVLEWQLLAHLWRRRQESHVFDQLPAPPPEVLTPHGQLREPSGFSDEQWLAFKAWRDVVAAHTGVDHLGAAYGRQVPVTTDLSD